MAQTAQTQGKVLFYDGVELTINKNNEIAEPDRTVGVTGNGIYFSEYNVGSGKWAYHIGHHGHLFTAGPSIANGVDNQQTIVPFTTNTNNGQTTIALNNSVNYIGGLASDIYAKTITPSVATIDFSLLVDYINGLQSRIWQLEHPDTVYYNVTIKLEGDIPTGWTPNIPTSLPENHTQTYNIEAPFGYSISSISVLGTGISRNGNNIVFMNLLSNVEITIKLTQNSYSATLKLTTDKDLPNGVNISDIVIIKSGDDTKTGLHNGEHATWPIQVKDPTHWVADSTGFTVTGGYIDNDLNVISNNITTSNLSVIATLHAKTNLTVTFHTTNGGSLFQIQNCTWYDNKQLSSSAINTLTNYSEDGKIIVGWAKTNGGSKVLDKNVSTVFVDSLDFYPVVTDATDYGYYREANSWEEQNSTSGWQKITSSNHTVITGKDVNIAIATVNNTMPTLTAASNIGGTMNCQVFSATEGGFAQKITINGKEYYFWISAENLTKDDNPSITIKQ